MHHIDFSLLEDIFLSFPRCQKVIYCLFLSSSRLFFAFVSFFLSSSSPPLSRNPFLHKGPSSPLYIIHFSYLGWTPGFVRNVLGIPHSRAASCCRVSAAIMQSWRVQDLPYWWNELLCCVVWWKEANMVSMNGRVPPPCCANAIMAS